MGDERAETYLWLLIEAVLRQAGGQLRAVDAAAGTDVWSDPGMVPFTTAESAQWKVENDRADPRRGRRARRGCPGRLQVVIFMRPSTPGHGSC